MQPLLQHLQLMGKCAAPCKTDHCVRSANDLLHVILVPMNEAAALLSELWY